MNLTSYQKPTHCKECGSVLEGDGERPYCCECAPPTEEQADEIIRHLESIKMFLFFVCFLLFFIWLVGVATAIGSGR